MRTMEEQINKLDFLLQSLIINVPPGDGNIYHQH